MAERSPNSLVFPTRKLYVFGEKILDETFQDVVLALLITSCFARHTYLGEQKFPGNHIIATIYEGTSDA
jgi:hypothetical protein